MFKQVVLVMTVGMGTLMGCSGSVCSRAERVYSDMADKARPCESQGFSVAPVDVDACEARLEKCSDAETEMAYALLDCMDKVGTCQASNTKPFSDAVQACVEQHKVSPGCNPY
jgi:hypothetical protein